jgi:hypothetical protein
MSAATALQRLFDGDVDPDGAMAATGMQYWMRTPQAAFVT